MCSNRTKIKRTDNTYIELNEHMEIEITAIEKNILPCTDAATYINWQIRDMFFLYPYYLSK